MGKVNAMAMDEQIEAEQSEALRKLSQETVGQILAVRDIGLNLRQLSLAFEKTGNDKMAKELGMMSTEVLNSMSAVMENIDLKDQLISQASK